MCTLINFLLLIYNESFYMELRSVNVFPYSGLLFSLSLLSENCIPLTRDIYIFASLVLVSPFCRLFLQMVAKRNPMRRHLRTILNTQPYMWEILLRRQGNSFDNITVTNMLIVVVETANLGEPATGWLVKVLCHL